MTLFVCNCRLNLARPCRQVSWKTDMGFHVAMFQGFFFGFLWFSRLRNPWKPKCLITDVSWYNTYKHDFETVVQTAVQNTVCSP